MLQYQLVEDPARNRPSEYGWTVISGPLNARAAAANCDKHCVVSSSCATQADITVVGAKCKGVFGTSAKPWHVGHVLWLNIELDTLA